MIAGLSKIVLGLLKAVVALALIIAIACAVAVWWWYDALDPIKTYRLHDVSGRTQQEQIQVLVPFSKKVLCEYLGTFVERDGKVALEFRINIDGGYEGLGCIKAQAPEGFIFVEVAD